MEMVSFVFLCTVAVGWSVRWCEAGTATSTTTTWTQTSTDRRMQTARIDNTVSPDQAEDVEWSSPRSNSDLHPISTPQPHTTLPENSLSVLPVNMTSNTSGYVVSGSCNKRLTCAKDTYYTVLVPKDHVTLITFPIFDMKWSWYSDKEGFVELASVHRDGSSTPIWRHLNPQLILPRLYNTSMRVRLVVPPRDILLHGFKMIFSIHPASQMPREVGEGKFNCSVPYYHTFQYHFHCDLMHDCLNEEDEGGHCPFSSTACNGMVAVNNKCYFHLSRPDTLSWRKARRICKRRGDLATMKTPAEWDAFLKLLHLRNLLEPVYVGMKSSEPSMPRIYAKSYLWVDNTVNYRYGTRYRNFMTFYDGICFFYAHYKVNDHFKYWLCYVPCGLLEYRDIVCQVEVQNATSKPLMSFPKGNATWIEEKATQSLTRCPEGHATHAFLLCDTQSHCGTKHYVSQCNGFNGIGYAGNAYTDAQNGIADVPSSHTIAMFVCDDSLMTLHYTLVCDFRQDCKDRSDETFCVHDTFCLDFTCHNGQCISKRDQCNGVKDCWDGSDEKCTYSLSMVRLGFRDPPPALITFHSNGNITHTNMKSCDECPDTHVCCAEGYCVPVYCRCNGLADCVQQEDEEDCDHFQCPGFYRCRSSRVCVHADHLCDGQPQCPELDDEWLCQITCPDGCLCQGQAFLCPQNVSLTSFPLLRYLDASGSGMRPRDVTGLLYLVWLSLSRCGVQQVSEMTLPNLKSLDMSQNQLALLNMDVFLHLRNLRNLSLSTNPLQSVFSKSSDTQNTRLVSMDMSGILTKIFNSTILVNYPRVSLLNLSYSALTVISQDGFRSLSNLMHIDLRGTNIRQYPRDVFQYLDKLQTVLAGQYKLCCKELLPSFFDERNCFAPKDEISSCADLLRSDTYRTFLWLFSVLSVTGNMGCLLTRAFLLKSKSLTAFSIFVNNLSIADLFMGVYLSLVGAADHVYRGRYFWVEETWKPSVACQLAGFLSLLSSETSAFIICLITLDRFLVLSSPFSQLRFKRRSAAIACLLVWLLGVGLSIVPLLPFTSHWEFYSQTGICVPLPITRKSFKGRDYAFGIIIIFNLVLFLLIASGQAMIYWTIRTTSMVQSTAKKSKELTIARRLVSVVVSDFLCWFPIGLLGLMAAHGMPIPGEVNVGMAIFVLPLNAALNPFLYTFNALMESWKKTEEDRLLKQLEDRAFTGAGDL